jgi:hypothetical protein
VQIPQVGILGRLQQFRLSRGPDLHLVTFLLLEFPEKTIGIPQDKANDDKGCNEQYDICRFLFWIKIHPALLAH